MLRTITKVGKGPSSTDAHKSASRESSAKNESLIFAKVTKSTTSKNNIVKSVEKREKPENAKKYTTKESEKLSSSSCKEEESLIKGRYDNRKEAIFIEENKNSQYSQEKIKQADKKNEVKTKEIKEDAGVIKKRFGDNIKIIRHMVSKEYYVKVSPEEKHKMNNIIKPESSKSKREKIDVLFEDKPKNRKEAAVKINIEQPSPVSSTTDLKRQKPENKKNAKTSQTSVTEKNKTAPSSPPSLVPDDVSSKKIDARYKVNYKKSNGTAENKIIERSLVEVQVKKQLVERKRTKPVVKKEISRIPVVQCPEEKIKTVVAQPAKRKSGSTTLSRSVSPRNTTAAAKIEVRPANDPVPSKIKKINSICKSKKDASTFATSSRRTTSEDIQDSKKKIAVSPLIKRKRSYTPDAVLNVAVEVDSIASTPDSKKVKVEVPVLSSDTAEYLSQLVELRQNICSLSYKLQRIVNVVKSSGIYEFSETTFDFDLITLDSETIRQLQQCFT